MIDKLEIIAGQPTDKSSKQSKAYEMGHALGLQSARVQQKLNDLLEQRMKMTQESIETASRISQQQTMLSTTMATMMELLGQAKEIKGEIQAAADQAGRSRMADMSMIPGTPPMGALGGLPPLGEPPAGPPMPEMMPPGMSMPMDGAGLPPLGEPPAGPPLGAMALPPVG